MHIVVFVGAKSNIYHWDKMTFARAKVTTIFKSQTDDIPANLFIDSINVLFKMRR